MANSKPLNPYTALLKRAHDFEQKVVNPFTKVATWFAKKDLEAGWNLKFGNYIDDSLSN